MPRKRKPKFSEYKIPTIDPEDRHAVENHVLIRHALVDFDELALLPSNTYEQLVANLVDAIGFWRAGVKPRKRGLSDEKEAQHIFISNVGRALERAGLSAPRWRKTYDGDGGPDPDAPQSFYFLLVRSLGDVFGIPLPKDLRLAGKRASKIQYGAMPPAMEAWQAAALLARRHRLGDLAVRLKTCATQGKGDLRLATATTLALPEPETVYEALPLELRLLALGLSSAKNVGGSSALAGSLFAG